MNITKQTLIALTALALAGCASVAGLREGKPDITLTTTKTPSDYGQCVANGWGQFFGTTVNHSTTPDGGYTVSMPNAYTGNNGVVDVNPSGAVQVHYRMSGLGGYGKYTKVVNDCR
ncbi:MAG: hypothetical protein EPN49_15800 [Rhodanobacter sp.]|nr:MAG: hypothetical protein EPN49_15800 [Rhodanobacter sp.]